MYTMDWKCSVVMHTSPWGTPLCKGPSSASGYKPKPDQITRPREAQSHSFTQRIYTSALIPTSSADLGSICPDLCSFGSRWRYSFFFQHECRLYTEWCADQNIVLVVPSWFIIQGGISHCLHVPLHWLSPLAHIASKGFPLFLPSHILWFSEDRRTVT